MASFSNQGSTWEKLSSELKEYGGKIDAAKAQFDDLSVNIDDFTKQLEEAAARERKITEMLNSFMAKIDNVSSQNWEGSTSQRSHHQQSPPKLLSSTPAWTSPPSLVSPQVSSSPSSAANNTSRSAGTSTPTFAARSSTSPLRSSDLLGSPVAAASVAASMSQLGDNGPQVHISRHGSISIMQPSKN